MRITTLSEGLGVIPAREFGCEASFSGIESHFIGILRIAGRSGGGGGATGRLKT